MQYQNVSILSLAHIDAPHRVTSSEMSQQFAATLERLGMRVEVLEYASGIEALPPAWCITDWVSPRNA